MKFPEEYRSLVYDILNKECNVYYQNEQHAQDNIFQRLNRLKTEEIMVTNNMPTANEELFENINFSF